MKYFRLITTAILLSLLMGCGNANTDTKPSDTTVSVISANGESVGSKVRTESAADTSIEVKDDNAQLAMQGYEVEMQKFVADYMRANVGEKWDGEDDTVITPLGDVNGDGTEDYTVNNDNHLWVFLDKEPIYHHIDEIRVWGTEGAAYADFDGDGEKELFVTIAPAVNSMPLMEYVVLKKKGESWVPLAIPEGMDGYDSIFKVFGTRTSTNLVTISCEGIDKTYTYDITENYKELITECDQYAPDLSKMYQNLLDGTEEPIGSKLGVPSAWGIWSLEATELNGKNCIKATQGVSGPYDTHDLWGEAYIYFCYNKSGEIEILDFLFVDWYDK